MVGLDLGTNTVPVLAWVAGGLAAIVFAAAVLAWRRGRTVVPVLALGCAVVLAGAALLVSRAQIKPEVPLPDKPEHSAIPQRLDALAAAALAADSPLACIDAAAGPTVESACEALLFGRPDRIAAAVNYVTAKLALLAEAATLARSETATSEAVAALRRGLEADRFGLLAHVLATGSGCTADRCASFALVADPQRIQANMREGLFDRLVARHAGNWPSGERPPAPAAGPRAGAGPVAKPLSPGYDFPSAASIPPVSIIAAEPPRPPERDEAAGAGAAASAGDRQGRKPAAPTAPAGSSPPSGASAATAPSALPPPLPLTAPRPAAAPTGAPPGRATPPPAPAAPAADSQSQD